jgi:hypothetical protein
LDQNALHGYISVLKLQSFNNMLQVIIYIYMYVT